MPVSILTPEKVLRRTHKKQKHDQFGNSYQATFAIKPDEILALKYAYLLVDINLMVYNLFELTKEEIAIVEGR